MNFDDWYEITKEGREQRLVFKGEETIDDVYNLSDKEAIELSAIKFEKIKEYAEKQGVILSWSGAYTCPLCIKYAMQSFSALCAGCPIYNYTGTHQCEDTPYSDIDEAVKGEVDEFVKQVQAEIDFLKMLLEKEQ